MQEKRVKKGQKWPRKKVLFHYDNVPTHTFVFNKIHELRYEPCPIFTDLALSDFFLFPKVEKFLARRKFLTNEEVITAAKSCFAVLEEATCKEGLTVMELVG